MTKQEADGSGRSPGRYEDAPEAILRGVPEPEYTLPELTVVGIGASAGGLAALKEFFANVPADSGLAFVVVVHLSPEHESHLPDLLQPHVRMPVQQVTETTPLEPNRVYIIPPGRNLSTIDTHLRVSDLEELRRERAPIDHFFRTLALTHDGHAIGVILTGTGSDGTLGIKEIKGRGGLTIVQDPREAEYDGMPQSAIRSGVIDLVLPIADIPAQILRIVRSRPRISLAEAGESIRVDQRDLLHRLLAQIRTRTGRDFTRYKRSTIMRRIRRRMQLTQTEELEEYVARLREDVDEVRTLSDDFLITVTSFFRDPEVYQRLEADVIPSLFAGRGMGDTLRVWSIGCATGEEAYSLAMALIEESARHATQPQIQIFATDLHDHSLRTAREGIYLGDIDAEVSSGRLQRFFTKENGAYRVRKEVRDLVVFAPHDLLSDPPFSRLDLIVCRNLLIYLEREVQPQVLELFHYALNSEGWLVLGTAETIEGSELFRAEDKRLSIHRRRNVATSGPRLPVFPVVRARTAAADSEDPARADGDFAGEVHARLAERYGPPSVLIGQEQSVVHVSEHAGRYLIHPGGSPTTNVFKLVRPELQFELRSVLHEALESGKPVRSKPIPVTIDGESRHILLHARRAPSPGGRDEHTIVFFDERNSDEVAGVAAQRRHPSRNARIRELELELDQTRHRLQTLIEEYESSREEMRSSNEEMQSANEELRSTMEELETSKEELQSVNEELQTVNQENRHKVEELSQLSSVLQSLMDATQIATLFLDRELRILRYTPPMTELFNLRASDRGRPLSDLTHRLVYSELLEDARSVLRTLVPVDREIQDDAERWYLTQVRPYRGPEDKIEGVVLTCIEITEQKASEEAMRRNETALMEADARKNDFLAVLSHELRNPLAPIRDSLYILNHAPPGAEEARRAVDVIDRQTTHLTRLVDDLLDITRITRNRIKLDCEYLELNAVVTGCAEDYRGRYADREIHLEVLTAPNPLHLNADRTRMAQIISNLLQNSAKFTPRGGRVDVTVSSEGGTAVVRVTDNGIGMEPNAVSHLFEPFMQVDTSLDRTRGGLGLGLALAKRLVELHGGSITASSPGLGQGCEFTIRLPLAATGGARRDRTAVAAVSEPRPLKILVIDDNGDAAEMLARALQFDGHEVMVAHAGREGLDLARRVRPDIVLCDIGLPDLDGYEVARKFRADPDLKSIHLSALTGYGLAEDAERAAAAGFDDHLVKPVGIDRIKQVLADVLVAGGRAGSG